MNSKKIAKLNNVAKSLLKRLSDRATELGLEADNLILMTSKECILTFQKRCQTAWKIREDFSLTEFVRMATKEILSLTIAIEDFSLT